MSCLSVIVILIICELLVFSNCDLVYCGWLDFWSLLLNFHFTSYMHSTCICFCICMHRITNFEIWLPVFILFYYAIVLNQALFAKSFKSFSLLSNLVLNICAELLHCNNTIQDSFFSIIINRSATLVEKNMNVNILLILAYWVLI